MVRVIFAAFVFSAATVIASPPLQVLSDQPLVDTASKSLDVRWTERGSLLFTTMASGVVEMEDDRSGAVKVVFAPPDSRHCHTCSRLGQSANYVVTAFPIGPIGWWNTSTSGYGTARFESVIDLDLHGDRLLILGSRRDDRGRWAPEGAIAWSGSLKKALADLRPVHYSSSKSKAMSVARCGFLENGAVRFFEDGTFVIVPGVEPGVFLYDARGELKHTWDTAPLRLLDRCDITEPQVELFSGDPEARSQWLGKRRTIEDILPLREGPALVVREVRQGSTHWKMVILRRNAPPREMELPFSAPSDVAFLKADLRGDRIAFLIRTFGQWRRGHQETPARLIIVEMR